MSQKTKRTRRPYTNAALERVTAKRQGYARKLVEKLQTMERAEVAKVLEDLGPMKDQIPHPEVNGLETCGLHGIDDHVDGTLSLLHERLDEAEEIIRAFLAGTLTGKEELGEDVSTGGFED